MYALKDEHDQAAADRDREADFQSLLSAAAWRRAAYQFGWTARETQIAEAICLGWSYVRIRAELHIEHSTLRTHLKSLYRKAGCRGRVDLILKLVHEFR